MNRSRSLGIGPVGAFMPGEDVMEPLRHYGLAADTLAASRNVPPAGDEAAADVLAGDAEDAGEFPVSDTVLVETTGLVDVKARRSVRHVVRGLFENFQVLKTVVGLVAVQVMDVFVGAKSPAKVTLHDDAVLVSLPALMPDYAVSRSVQPVLELPSVLAWLGAKRLAAWANARRLALKFAATMGACACLDHASQNTMPINWFQPLRAEGVE